jgi:glycosyltransferase involved in cell wall biosynthesis
MKTPIKLLHIINNYTDTSLNRLVLNLTKGIRNQNYQFYVGCLEKVGGPLEKEFRQAGAKTINFGMKNYLHLGIVKKIKDYINKNEIDIVHTHILKADFLGGLPAKVGDGPILVATKHNENFSPGQAGWIWRNPLFRLALLLPDLVVTVSNEMRDKFIVDYGLRPERVITIHNGIDIEYFDKLCHSSKNRQPLREEWGLITSDFVVGFIGRLVTGKGLSDLLNAMRLVISQHNRCFLLIVGKGPRTNYLKRKVKELGIEANVIITGYRSDIPEILSEIDVLTLPSLSEGLPLSVIEAMAAEKAVIATPVGGIREIIVSGETGLLIEPKNPEAIANAISQLLNNKKLRSNLGANARAFIRHDFDSQVMYKKYDQAYQNMVQSKNTIQIDR